MMAGKVLYLFNSASRAAYKDNLYKLLALPSGGKTSFRYSLKHNVPEGLSERLQGCEALIVFVDKFSKEGYTYYPVRKAKVLWSSRMQNRLIIECRLFQYCDTDSPKDFTKALQDSAQGVPALKNDDPTNTNDGYYVQFGDEIKDGLLTDADRWISIVQNICKTDAFHNERTAFLKLSVKREKKAESEIFCGKDGVASLKSGDNYTLEIFYYDPDEGKIDKQVVLSLKDALDKYGSDRYKLGAISDRLDIQFKASKTMSSLRTSIDIVVGSEGSEKYRLSLPIRVSSLSLLAGVIFYSGIGFATFIVPEHWTGLNADNWSLACEIIRYIVIVRIFIKFGTLPNFPFKS